MIKVFLADNHAVVRDGIRRVLADDPRIQVVGEASDFTETIAKARRIGPEVMVLDVHMPFEPNLSFRELAVQLHSSGAEILGVSFANDDDAKSLATQLGAAELLDKIEVGKLLIPAILRLASSRPGFPPPAVAKSNDRRAL